MKTLTVVVPIFNESRTIVELINQLESLPNDVVSFCIFVNDGSKDHSLQLVRDRLATVEFLNLVIDKPNGGKSSAIKAALPFVTSSHVAILDADLELKTTDLLRLWEVVLEGESDIVFGYRRFVAQSAFTYRYVHGNQILSNLYGILFNEVITDVMCGYKLLPTELLKSLPFKFGKFAIEVEIPLHLWINRLRPYEIEVAYNPRTRDTGKIIGTRDAIQIIWDLFWFRIISARKRISR